MKGSRFRRCPVMPIWSCCCFLEQETLLTLPQSTQLYIVAWYYLCNINGYLHGAYWGSKYPIVLVTLGGVGVTVELWVPRPLFMRPGQFSYRLLALPKEDLPAQGSSA